MGFEAVVLDKVAKVLKSQDQASFFCGSLSVICDEAEARKNLSQVGKRLQEQSSNFQGWLLRLHL